MHLLVIEDDPRLGRLLKRLLEDDQHLVELAADGRTGIEIAEAGPGSECIVLDVGLPDIDGLEVARPGGGAAFTARLPLAGAAP